MESTTALPIIWKDTLIPIPENVHQQQHLVRIDDDISKEVVSSSSFENIYFPKNKSGITPKDTKESLMSTRKRKQTLKTSKQLKREMKLSKKKSHILFRNAIFGLLSAYVFLALSNRQFQGICRRSIPTNPIFPRPRDLNDKDLQILQNIIDNDLEIDVKFFGRSGSSDLCFLIKREDGKIPTKSLVYLVECGYIKKALGDSWHLFGKLDDKIRKQYDEEAPFWYLFEQWSSVHWGTSSPGESISVPNTGFFVTEGDTRLWRLKNKKVAIEDIGSTPDGETLMVKISCDWYYLVSSGEVVPIFRGNIQDFEELCSKVNEAFRGRESDLALKTWNKGLEGINGTLNPAVAEAQASSQSSASTSFLEYYK